MAKAPIEVMRRMAEAVQREVSDSIPCSRTTRDKGSERVFERSPGAFPQLCDDIVNQFENEIPWQLPQIESEIAVQLLKDVVQRAQHPRNGNEDS